MKVLEAVDLIGPSSLCALTTLLLVFPSGAMAQETPTLDPSEYGRWESLGAATIGPFGRFVAHTLSREDETTELRVIGLEADTTWTVPWGTHPVFSPDGAWVAWSVGVSTEEAEKIEEEGEEVRMTAQLLDLNRGDIRALGVVRELHFGPTGGLLALLGYAPDEPEGVGANLRVLDLRAGTEVGFSNVGELRWADDLPLLAMVLATGMEEGNGVQLYDGRTGAVRGLDASEARYTGLAWSEGSSDVAVLRASTEEEVSRADVLVWREAHRAPTRLELAADAGALADSLQVVDKHAPEWSRDGRRVTIGLRHRAEEVAADANEEVDSTDTNKTSTVQVWHSTDVHIIAEQKAHESEAESRTLLASWHPESGRVTQVGHDLLADAWVAGQRGFERRSDPYPFGAKFGRPYHDLWTVDLESGLRTLLLERARYDWTSPDGRWMLWFDGQDYSAIDAGTGQATNLTEGVDATFANVGWDTPTDDFLPPYGFGGWVTDQDAVLLYDQFDVWKVDLAGGSANRLTEGASDQVVHRMLDLDPEEAAFSASDLMFNIRGEWTEDRGFARWSSRDGYQRLILEAKRFRSVVKADSANAVVYRRESRTDSPDYLVSGLDFRDPELVTETNPFMSEYAWTRTELVEYKNAEGTRLHGVLMYPANHDPSRPYPMIVYAYELLSPQIHSWQGPSERSYYNQTTWTQQGYFVLMPDIVFRARDPGVSTAETMEAAISAVEAKGLIDRERVGFVGHSWGGYEAAYLAARTDLFATAVAGAPLTDFVSFMGSIHWNPGIAESDHWETGQARMAVPYWEDTEAHERNSPLHGVHTMTTPLLMAHGSEDGVVEFFQATEFYNFARRAEKEMVLLVYEGEDHGFRQKANQVDYHRRILEWFGHYLKGEPAPSWITDGVRWEDHEEERGRVAKGAN